MTFKWSINVFTNPIYSVILPLINVCLFRQSTRTALNWATKAEEENEDLFTAQQAQIKQGWSLLATLHCVLLPDKVVQAGSKNFKRPQVEMMARRWQHQCLEVC